MVAKLLIRNPITKLEYVVREHHRLTARSLNPERTPVSTIRDSFDAVPRFGCLGFHHAELATANEGTLGMSSGILQPLMQSCIGNF